MNLFYGRKIKTDFMRSAAPRVGGAGSNDNKDLPAWSLTDLYSGFDSKEFLEDKEKLEAAVLSFAKNYEERVEHLDAEELQQAIKEYEDLETRFFKIDVFISLYEMEDVRNTSKTDELKKWLKETGDDVGFFTHELTKMNDVDTLIRSGPYGPWLASLRANNKFLLPDDAETITAEGISADLAEHNTPAWTRLYNQIYTSMRVDINGVPTSIEETDGMLVDDSISPEEKRNIRKSMLATLKEEAPRIAFIYNNIIQDNLTEMKTRGYTRPDQSTHIANGMDAAMVDTMLDVVRSSYASLSNRFFYLEDGTVRATNS